MRKNYQLKHEEGEPEDAPAESLQTAGDPRRLRCTIPPSRRRAVVATRRSARRLRDLVTADVGIRLAREENGLEKLNLLRLGRVDEVVELIEAVERGNDAEGVSLAFMEKASARGSGRRSGLTYSTRKPWRFDE